MKKNNLKKKVGVVVRNYGFMDPDREFYVDSDDGNLKSEITLDSKRVESINNMTDEEYLEAVKTGNFDNVIKNKEPLEIKPIKIKEFSPEKIKELEKFFERVVVHDYNDEYHMTDEERAKRNKYHSAETLLRKSKRKYKNLVEFVKAYRTSLDILKLVSKDNGVYKPNDFVKRVLKGDIKINGFFFPKYIGKDKKIINWKYVIQFITNRELDPEDLREDKEDDEDNDIDLTYERLFSEEEREKIDKYINGTPIEELIDMDNSYIKSYKQKELKKLFKSDKTTSEAIKEHLRELIILEKRRNTLNQFMYGSKHEDDDWDKIEKYDKRMKYKSSSDIPKFKGDILNRKDYKKYMYDLEQWYKENVKYEYRGKVRTVEEIRELELAETLENAGWNIRNLYKNKEEKKERLKAIKKAKEKEKKLKEKLLKINKLQEKVKSDGPSFGSSFKSKKTKKKKNKKNNEIKMNSKKSKKMRKKYEKLTDDLSLSLINKEGKDFEQYKKEMEDFSMKGYKNGRKKK